VASAARPHHVHSAFGEDTFGRFAEKTARFFGTPQYIVGQTIIVLIWIAANAWLLTHPYDKYPFVLLNLVFSTQAAYAAPLILLAQTRQADRDKAEAERVDERHTQLETSMKGETDKLLELLRSNTSLTRQDTELTEQIASLTREIHELLTARPGQASGG
jgi:uncharacterized membrane protein